MTRITDGSVSIQISSESVPAMPSWFGEVAAFARVLTHQGTLTAISEQVRFARARFGKSRSHRFRRGVTWLYHLW